MAGALLRVSTRKVRTACRSGRVLAQLETRPLLRLCGNSNFMPQRGRVLQPKVARFGATLGGRANWTTNRNAVAASCLRSRECPGETHHCRNPFRVDPYGRFVPKVAPKRATLG